MARKLIDVYTADAVDIEMSPSNGGAFEVLVGGEKVYSKLETGRFPGERALIKDIGPKLG